MLHIPEALRHTVMPGLQPGRTRKKYTFVSKCSLCCISQKRSGIRWCQDSSLAEPEKDIQHLSKILSQNVYFYYVAYSRSAQVYGDARTPTWLNQKKIYNVCLKFVLKCLLCCISQKRSGIRWSQDSNLGEPEKDIQCLSKILSQNVYYVEYPRSAQAYGDDRSATWVNEKRYSNSCVNSIILFLMYSV